MIPDDVAAPVGWTASRFPDVTWAFVAGWPHFPLLLLLPWPAAPGPDADWARGAWAFGGRPWTSGSWWTRNSSKGFRAFAHPLGLLRHSGKEEKMLAGMQFAAPKF